MITAIGNDENLKKFSRQLENYAKNGDLLIVLSCSGKLGILRCLNFKKKRLEVIKFLVLQIKIHFKEITFL